MLTLTETKAWEIRCTTDRQTIEVSLELPDLWLPSYSNDRGSQVVDLELLTASCCESELV